jgi:hypothetical protein
MAIFTNTQDFFIERPAVIAVDPASTGTLTVQLQVGNAWSTAGAVTSTAPQIVDARLCTIRCLVSGTVTYDVQVGN